MLGVYLDLLHHALSARCMPAPPACACNNQSNQWPDVCWMRDENVHGQPLSGRRRRKPQDDVRPRTVLRKRCCSTTNKDELSYGYDN